MSRSLQVGDVYVTDDALRSEAAAAEAEANALRTAADVLATAADRIQTGLDRDFLDVNGQALSEALATINLTLVSKADRTEVDALVAPINASLLTKAATTYVDQKAGQNSDKIDLVIVDVASVKLQVAAIAAGQSSGAIIARTWAGLNSIPPATNGARAEVIGTATTTHADPVASGNPQVLDPGTYRGSLSPLGWERIGPTTASAAASQLATGATPVTTITDTTKFMLLAPDGSAVQTLSGAIFKALVEEYAMPRLYPQEIRGVTVTNTSSVALTIDDKRRGDVSIQIVGSGDIGCRWGSGSAVFGDDGTWVQKSGQWINHPNPGTGLLNVVGRRAEGDDTPVTLKLNIRVQRTEDTVPTAPGPADLIFSKWTDPVDARYSAVIRQEVQYLIDNGIYPLLKGWWMPGSTKNNFRVNLANPNGPLLTYNEGTGNTPIAFTPYKGIGGNGTDQHISTGILPADAGMTVATHLLMARAMSTTAIDSGQMMGNDGTLFLQPNRGAQLYGSRSGPGTDTNSATPRALGLWSTLSRDSDPANYAFYIDGDLIATNARALPSMIARQFNLLAGSGVTGIAARSTIYSAGTVLGQGLAPISVQRLTNSLKRIDAVCAQIAGA